MLSFWLSLAISAVIAFILTIAYLRRRLIRIDEQNLYAWDQYLKSLREEDAMSEPVVPTDGDQLDEILSSSPQPVSVKVPAGEVDDETPASEDPVQEDGTVVLKPRAAEGEVPAEDLRYRQDPNDTQDIRFRPVDQEDEDETTPPDGEEGGGEEIPVTADEEAEEDPFA